MFDPTLNGNEMIGVYNLKLVFLSYFIAAFASYTVLDLSMRIGESHDKQKKFWISGCAFAMGGGIWAMHFTGMLAFELPIATNYDVKITILSLLFAIVASGCAFFYVSQKTNTYNRVLLGGIFMGSGVGTMHYTGMQAMNFSGSMYYKPIYFVASIFIAIVASTVALRLILYFETNEQKESFKYKVFASLIMGLAVSGMHYTGMNATVFISNVSTTDSFDNVATIPSLAFSILGITMLILVLAIIASRTQGEFNHLEFAKNKLEELVQKRTQELKALASFPSENTSPIFRVDSNNILLYSNSPGLSFLSEWNRQIGDPIPSFFAKLLNRTKKTKEDNKLEIFQDNKTFEFDIVNVPEMNYFNIYGHNITKRKIAESNMIIAKEKAEQANQAKTQFLTHISHELRTPMNAILGFTELINRDSMNPLPNYQKQQLNQITSSGKHLLKLINEMLDLSTVESGNIKLSIESVEIVLLVEEVIIMCNSHATQNGIIIEHKKTLPDRVFVNADVSRLKQVILNLVSNAIKYNKPNGKVLISYIKQGSSKIRFGIKDSGYGIPDEQKDKVFKPFERLHPDIKNIEGTGIGLTISKQLIELMAGTINFESVTNEGSYFFIDLPLSQNIPIAKDTKELNDLPVIKLKSNEMKTVLYIEDVQVNIKLVEHILSLRNNIRLLSAKRAYDGIEIAKSKVPDLILMDIRLPDIDGFTAFKKLQLIKEVKNIPVIALTANALEDEAQKALELGFKNYLTKPLNIEEFLKVIDKLLF
jgi:NO-binding membrane sensor protein with MHYT domain/CheY-like chemotaxis protein/nitrogen-specific signal transduction histidine kinase